MSVRSLFENINRGKKGLNKGIPQGLPKVDSITYGLQRRWMTIIGADSGAGKSSYMLYTSIYKPYMEYISNPKYNLNWLIFSFEMSAEVLFAKLMSIYIYEKFNVVIPYGDILSFNSPISDDNYNLTLQARSWLEVLEKHCTIIDKPTTADGLYAICKEWSRKFGTYEKVGEHKEEFIPNDPEQYLIVCVDHIKLLATSHGSTSKQEIDKACDYLIYFRNKCSFTEYIVQQLNRNFKNMERRTAAGGVFAGIQLDDFSDSSGPIQAAETVIAIFHPLREKMSKCEKYDITKLRDRARIITILKHRFGVADKSIGIGFYGEVGLWKELPMPDQITDYDKLIIL